MQLFVVRHAIAKDHSPTGDDADRALTKVGIKKLKRGVRGIRELGIGFDRVLTSPWLRAVDTAALLAKVASSDPIVTPLLAAPPRADLYQLIAETAGPAHAKRGTAIVGHEPWLSELVAWLAFGDSRHGEAIDVGKGSLVWLDGTLVPGGMAIRAVLPAKVLRAIA